MKIVEKFETPHMLFLSVVEMKIIFEITQDCSHQLLVLPKLFFRSFLELEKFGLFMVIRRLGLRENIRIIRVFGLTVVNNSD